MQYISDCLQSECDHYWAGPHERETQRKARDHAAGTGHTVHYKGRYDAPPGAGLYRDGEKLDLSPREKQDLLRAARYSEVPE